MTLNEIIAAVTDLIGQTGVSNPYINDEQIKAFVNEGIDGLCRYGRVYPIPSGSLTSVDNVCTIELKAISSKPVIEVFDLVDATGKSLTRIRPWEQGRALGEIVGTPLWWYWFGGYLWINPTPGTGVGAAGWIASAYCIAPSLSTGTDEPLFPVTYHYGLVCYGAYRAKQATGRYDEAAVYLKQYLDFVKMGYNQRTATLRGFTRGVDLMAAKQGATLGGAQ